MTDIALMAGGAIFLAVLLAAAAYSRRRPNVPWDRITRTQAPYKNLHEDEIREVDNRDKFIGAVEESLVRHYGSKPVSRRALKGGYTRNDLFEDITRDVNRNTSDVLLPGEKRDVIEKSYDKVLRTWNKERRKKR